MALGTVAPTAAAEQSEAAGRSRRKPRSSVALAGYSLSVAPIILVGSDLLVRLLQVFGLRDARTGSVLRILSALVLGVLAVYFADLLMRIAQRDFVTVRRRFLR